MSDPRWSEYSERWLWYCECGYTCDTSSKGNAYLLAAQHKATKHK